MLQPLPNDGEVLLTINSGFFVFRLELELYLSTTLNTRGVKLITIALTAKKHCSHLWSFPNTVLANISTVSPLAWLLFFAPSAPLRIHAKRELVANFCIHTLSHGTFKASLGTFTMVIH